MKPKSLKSTLLLGVALLVAISGLGIAQFVTNRYTASLLEGAAAKAENIAHKLALDSAEMVFMNNLPGLQKMLDDQIVSDPTVAYAFIIRGAMVLAHTFPNEVPVYLIAANSPVDKDIGHLEKVSSNQEERFLDVAWPIEEGRAGILRLGLLEAPFRRQASKVWIQMNLAACGILALALVSSLFMITILTRPLQELTATVEEISEGNLEVGIEVKGLREVSRLSSAFNAMLFRLKEYTQTLKDTNQQLEEEHLKLNRAHQLLSVSFETVREIGALTSLLDIVTHLISTFTKLLGCQNMVFLIFGNRQKLYVSDENHIADLDSLAFKFVSKLLKNVNFPQTMKFEQFSSEILPAKLESAAQLMAIPFYYKEHLLGTLVVGCPESCLCSQQEIEVIGSMLNQTSGAIKRAVKNEEEIQDFNSQIEKTSEFSGLIGKDLKMQSIYRLIQDAAPTDATVLIMGESGTGKELVAHAIHQQSLRKNKPFVVIDCSAYSATILESELFGHEKGSFTGSLRQKLGRFEQAKGGTVFLDEIGEISPSAQKKLLRVLQSQKFERLGGEQTIHADTRVVAASNRDLLEEVKQGRFREDLYYRLNVIPLNMPPLRERSNDIPLLAQYFLNRFAAEQGKNINSIQSEVMRQLLDYPWPGNVRELENCIEHAVVLSKDNLLRFSDLPSSLIQRSSVSQDPPNHTMIKHEEQLLKEALEQCKGNKSAAAMRLGISRNSLYHKIKKFKI